MTSFEAIHGCLVGTIVGDAMGLPYEALSAKRARRLLGSPDRHRFVFGRGMMSDDGEHACMVAQCLCEFGGDVRRFEKSLARRLRWWLACIPAGVGGATLRATLKRCVGFGPSSSGVYSAGNGPAMRSALLGAAIDDVEQLRDLVAASTRITHTDPKAFYGAMAVALAARNAAQKESPEDFLVGVRSTLPKDEAAEELVQLLERAVASAAAGHTVESFAQEIGWSRRNSGYIYKTVPLAVHAAFRFPNHYGRAVGEVIRCGGDTDTVAAIAGGIVGARVGVGGIPIEWRDRLLEWPRTRNWVQKLAEAVQLASDGNKVRAPRVGPMVLLRNLAFLIVVLAHLVRRALPPY